MRKFLNTDLAVRIISVVLAIIVWIYVVILLDPAIDITISDIPVIYTNTINLTNSDYILMNEKSNTVSLKIRGSRTMLAKINNSDINAFADLNGYNQTGSFSIPINIRLPYEDVTVVEKRPATVNVQIDKLITQTFPVTVEVTGTPQEGFEVYSPIASQSFITLKGPNDIVTTIERVVASIDVTGASSDVVGNKALTYYNTNEDIISNKYLTVNPEKLEVRCGILKRKMVPIKAALKSHDPKYSANILTNSFVTILAKPDVVDNINELFTKPIDVSHVNSDTRVTAKIDFPEGVFTHENVSEVTVDITVNKQ